MHIPSYLDLQINKIIERAKTLRSMMDKCELCPRKCGAKRNEGEVGFCHLGRNAVVSSAHPHFGEEYILVGLGGSGTIFFSGCTLRCVYCQNYDISQTSEGIEASPEEIAKYMLRLQDLGCHNINFVTPTHVLPMILESLVIAIENGLKIPLVYNTSGYERVEILKLLDGIFDIYLPDAKYWNSDFSEKYSHARDYPEVMQNAISEMYRQVGNVVTENIDGIPVAVKGIIVRHLVLPNNIAGSKEILDFLASISPGSNKISVNIMDQYRPCYQAYKFPELSRRPYPKEYLEVLRYAQGLGLNVL